MSFLSNLGTGLKRMTSMVFRRTSYRIFQMPGSNVDYLSKVGDGTGSSTVAAPLMWIARTFPEAPPSLWQEMENGQEEQVRQHDMLRLLARPNAYYTGPILWMATTMDWNVDGNAYWLKLRDQDGIVRQLWWVPHWMIEPKGDESTFIDHYEYTPGTEKLRIEKEDVVHFRNGLDSEDSKLGSSPLKSVLREVFTDDEAAAFTASLLGNMGVPGLVVAPGAGVTIDPQTALDVKKDVSEKFSGDRRGEAIVMTGPTEIHQFGFSPEQLVLKDLRRIPEERVTAVLGVPAIVAGLGAGLDRSTFTNMGEARAAAYESGLIPMQRILAEDIRFQLLNEFEPDPFVWRFGFDLTKVRVLQEDLYRQAQRWDLMVRGGWAQVSEGRRGMGLDVDDQRDHVFLRPLNVEAVAASDGVQIPQTVGAQAALQASERMLELEESVETSKELVVSQFADMKAMVAEWRPAEAEPPVVNVNFHEGAFNAPPAPNVTVLAPPPAEVHVTPEILATLSVPKRTLVMKREDGTSTTYEEE